MVRDWQIVKEILINVENNTLHEFFLKNDMRIYNQDTTRDDAKTIVLCHFEILLDAGILKNGQVTRRSDGSFGYWDFQGVLHIDVRA